MRILFVVDLAYPDHAGGSHRFCYEVARRLVQRGHEVHLITGKVSDDPATPDDERIDGVSYHRLSRDKRNFVSHALSYILGARRTFDQLARQAPFDVISAHYVLPTLGVLLSPWKHLTPVVFTFHGPWTGEFGVELQREGRDLPTLARLRRAAWIIPTLALTRGLERLTLARSARLHTLSQYTAEIAVRDYGVPRSKIVVVPGGVDTARFAPAADRIAVRQRLDLPSDRPLLLTVRRLYARMGLENLVQAMRTVIRRQPRALLLVVGKGPLRGRLQALVEQFGLAENVRLLGYVEDGRLPLYYQAADFFILPTLYLEGFGLVTLEALACGTPVLGTPVGGTVEILSGLDPRLLFASSRPEDMAKGMLEHLSAAAISRERCRRYVLEHYSWDKTTIELEAIFRLVTETV